MSGVPTPIQLARALHFLEGAQLQLNVGNIEKAAENMEKAHALLKELTTR